MMTGRSDVLEDTRLITKAAVNSGEGITIPFSSMTGSPCTEVQRSGYMHTSEHVSTEPTLETTFLLYATTQTSIHALKYKVRITWKTS